VRTGFGISGIAIFSTGATSFGIDATTTGSAITVAVSS
jgi:Ethanolamine utilization protein EutJ (predicted chaperonin)